MLKFQLSIPNLPFFVSRTRTGYTMRGGNGESADDSADSAVGARKRKVRFASYYLM